MSTYRTLTIAALSFLGGIASAQTTLPEPPKIWREVTGVVYTDPLTTVVSKKLPVHTDAHVPSFRTSRDGRIGLRVLPSADFTLLMPEKLTTHVRLAKQAANKDNSYVMSKEGYVYVNGVSAANSPAMFYSVTAGMVGSVGHFTLYDPTPTNPTSGENTNPKAVLNSTTGQWDDRYDLKVFAGYNYDDVAGNGANRGKMQFFVTPVQVFVTNPKTINASIRAVTRTGNPVAGPVYATLTAAASREMNIVGNGRLIVLRTGGTVMPWSDPVTGAPHSPQEYDIVYSYYTAQEGAPCDPTKWTTLIPISHAPFDSRINTQFGFAMSPFREPSGNVITDGIDIGGTYPWIDRNAKNLFFTAVRDTLRYQTGSGSSAVYTSSRYVQIPTPGEQVDNTAEEGSGTRGICVAGLWTHGKVVVIDNLNNDMDYSMNAGDNLYTRLVKLFDSGAATGAAPDWLKMGGGRVNSSPNMPPGDNRNSTIIESLENLFNYRKFAKPMTVRDVVWPLHNAKHSDDLAFDEYVDPDAFIVANMSGLVTLTPGSTFASITAGGITYTNVPKAYSYAHSSGWSTTTNSFSGQVKMQNAATTLSNRWVVPASGLVTGPGRLEPAATGGIHGKGFWMNGSIGLQFTVGTQPQNVSARDWYAGLFVDSRSNDTTPVLRALVSFPDNSSICLNGRSQVIYFDATGNSVRTISLPVPGGSTPDMLPYKGWAHLAWQIRNGGKDIEFLLNGLTFDRQSFTAALFQMKPTTGTSGVMSIGSDSRFPGEPGFKGWVDDFVVLAHTVDPETACNHAGGTLIGLPAGYTGSYGYAATLFPLSNTAITNRLLNSGKTSYPAYANYTSYSQDNGVDLNTIPAGTVSLRQSIHFPEGPLFFNRPRPDSMRNQFCISCHNNEGKAGLDMMALELISGLNANQDDRRQPSQPFRRLFGYIPAALVDFTGQPASATVLPAAGQIIDNWMQPTFVSATVKTFTLVNATNNTDLAPLKNGDVVNRASYGATSYAIRANLDSAQGNVTLTFDSGASESHGSTDPLPYAITPASFTSGTHTITATPQLGGVPVTITFTVQ